MKTEQWLQRWAWTLGYIALVLTLEMLLLLTVLWRG